MCKPNCCEDDVRPLADVELESVTLTYQELIKLGYYAIRSPSATVEYRRGVVALINWIFPDPGMFDCMSHAAIRKHLKEYDSCTNI